MHTEREGHVAAPLHRIGGIGYELTVEIVEPGIAQIAGDASALIFEHIAVQKHTGMYVGFRRAAHYYPSQSAVRDIVPDIAHGERIAGIDAVHHVHALAARLRQGIGFDRCVREAAVHHCQTQLIARSLSEGGIVDNRRLADAPEPAVVPLCGITSRKTVGGKLQARESEHLVVGCLSEIVV